MLGHYSPRPSGRSASDNLIRGDDEVDAEVVIGLGQLAVDDLELMYGRDDHGFAPDLTRLGQ